MLLDVMKLTVRGDLPQRLLVIHIGSSVNLLRTDMEVLRLQIVDSSWTIGHHTAVLLVVIMIIDLVMLQNKMIFLIVCRIPSRTANILMR